MTFLVTAGCSGRREITFSTLELVRTSWDSLQVEVGFTSSQPVGRSAAFVPDSVIVRVFDASYDVLYEGGGVRLGIRDALLASREEIVVEACGTFSSMMACEQRKIRASPKRLRWKKNLTYPTNGLLDQGSYDFGFRVERQRFGTDEWEELMVPTGLEAYMLVSVAGREETGMRVSIQPGAGRFDFSRSDNFQEYDYRLSQGIARHDSVPIRFDIFVGLHREPVLISSLERVVRRRTAADREMDVEDFVQQAAERILKPYEPYERAYVYVGHWQFDESTAVYLVPMRIHWGGSKRSRTRLDGTLEVSEDGESAVFEPKPSGRRREWDRRRVEDAPIVVGPLRRSRPEPSFDRAEEAFALL